MSPPAPGEGEAGGAASGGEGGQETRRPWRHFAEQLAISPSVGSSAAFLGHSATILSLSLPGPSWAGAASPAGNNL